MRSYLTEQVGVPASAVVELRNGVSGVDAELETVGVIDLPSAAEGGFWLAMGRAEVEWVALLHRSWIRVGGGRFSPE